MRADKALNRHKPKPSRPSAATGHICKSVWMPRKAPLRSHSQHCLSCWAARFPRLYLLSFPLIGHSRLHTWRQYCVSGPECQAYGAYICQSLAKAPDPGTFSSCHSSRPLQRLLSVSVISSVKLNLIKLAAHNRKFTVYLV